MSRNKPIGVVVYKGPSLIDQKPIIVVATGVWTKTENEKIGDMIQFWILRREIPPIIAAKIGEDFSVCGDCKHRDFGSCYVNLCHGPYNVYQAFHNDRYIDFDMSMLKLFHGRALRIGAYGDPAAVPYQVWNSFCDVGKIHTGYTHQWKNKNCDQNLRFLFMASCDSKEEKNKAQAMGWRTFRIRTDESDSNGSGEFLCPASREAGKKTSCEACGACNGLYTKINRPSPTIIVHGGGACGFKMKRFKVGMKKIKNKKKWKKEFSRV